MTAPLFGSSHPRFELWLSIGGVLSICLHQEETLSSPEPNRRSKLWRGEPRQRPFMSDFVYKLPKAELHLHIEGTL